MKIFLGLTVVLALVMGGLTRVLNVVSMSQEEGYNDRPIIGILTEPVYNKKHGDEFILASYVQYVESAGARVVPIRGNQPSEYYTTLFKNINGVLFPGGGANITGGPYYDSGKILYNLALHANNEGDYFPIWGTCLGMEALTVLTLGQNILSNTDSGNLTLPLDLVEGFQDSKLFRNIPSRLVNILLSEPVTQNNHQYSLLYEDFKDSEVLSSFYKVLSTNKGRGNLEFVSTMEAYKYPIYAVQWHPEKNVFKWNPASAVDHSFHAVRVTQYMADFFVNEARKSSHRYESSDEEAKAVIENYMRLYVPDGRFMTKYYFNYTTKA